VISDKKLASTEWIAQLLITIPFVCLYTVLLKLNFTVDFALFTSSMKIFLEKSGDMSLPNKEHWHKLQQFQLKKHF